MKHPLEHEAVTALHRQWFSRLGWALFAQMAAMTVVQLLAGAAVRVLRPELMTQPVFLWLLSAGSAYGVGFPAALLVLRGLPLRRPPSAPMSPAAFGQALVTTLGLVYLSNAFTLVLTRLIGALRGSAVTNPVDSLSGYPVLLNLLLGCVIAPVAEEVLFRRLLLERLRPYGDRFAILASALCFGLFHGNLNQFFYACAVGALFACIVLRTGCLWQTILLHALTNATSVLLIPLLGRMGEIGTRITALLVPGAIVIGLTFLIAGWRDIRPAPASVPLEEGQVRRLFLLSPGVLAFCLLSLLLAASYLL